MFGYEPPKQCAVLSPNHQHIGASCLIHKGYFIEEVSNEKPFVTNDWVWGFVFFCGTMLGTTYGHVLTSKPGVEAYKEAIRAFEERPVSNDYLLSKEVLETFIETLKELREHFAEAIPSEGSIERGSEEHFFEEGMKPIEEVAQHHSIEPGNPDKAISVGSDISATGIKVITAGESIRLRERPDKNAQIISIVDNGTPLLAKSLRDDWIEVTSPLGSSAWVYKDFLKYVGETSDKK